MSEIGLPPMLAEVRFEEIPKILVYSTSALMIEGIIACFVGKVGAFERNGQWITSGVDCGSRDFLLSFILAKGRIAGQ